jgi:hypothetical protein
MRLIQNLPSVNADEEVTQLCNRVMASLGMQPVHDTKNFHTPSENGIHELGSSSR